MLTATGRQYWPLDPRPEDVELVHIATALGKECRYNGSCRGFYSVAEHSVLVSLVVPPEHALQGLLHDAPEAYVKDITRPVKRGLGKAYADIEDLNWLAIASHFGISPVMHSSVKAADDAVLMAERDQIMPQGGPQWAVDAQPAKVRIFGLEWPSARDAFIKRFMQLTRPQ